MIKIFFIFFLLSTSAYSSQSNTSKVTVWGSQNPPQSPVGSQTIVIDSQKFTGRNSNLSNILESVSGVYVSQGSLQKEQDNFSIRGFSGNKIQILIDGVPLTQESQSSRILQTMPQTVIDKIIITKGPLSGLYGSGSLGGTINIITKNNLRRMNLSYLFGSQNTQLLNAQFYKNTPLIKASLVGYSNQSNGDYQFKNPKKHALYDHQQNKKLRLANNKSQSHGVQALIASRQKKIPLKLNLKYDNTKKGIPGKLSQSFQAINETHQEFLGKISLNDIVFQSSTFNGNFFYLNSLKNYKDPLGEQNGFPVDEDEKSSLYGSQFNHDYSFSKNIFLKSKINLKRNHFKSEELAKSRDTLLISSLLDLNFYSGHLNISPYFSFSHTSLLLPQLSWGLSQSLEISKRLHLNANIGTGFRYPSLDELFLNKGFIVGNPHLKTERNFGGDLGLTYKKELFSIGGSYFYYKTKNLIHYLLVSGFQYKPFNFNKTITHGYDIDLKYKPFSFLSTKTTLTHQNVINKNKKYFNKTLPNKPIFFGQQKISFSFLKKINLFGEYLFAFDRYVNQSNTKKILDRNIFNLGFQYGDLNSWLLSLEIKNIFDSYHIDFRGFPLSERSAYVSLYYNL